MFSAENRSKGIPKWAGMLVGGVVLLAASCTDAPPPAAATGPGIARPIASTEAERAAEKLIQTGFGSQDGKKWVAARRELVAIGKPAVPFLVYAMATGDSIVQKNCLETLVDIGPLAADKVSPGLDSADAEFRKNSAIALGQIRFGAPRARLEELAVSDVVWSVRAASAEALGGVRDPASVPVLRRCLSDEQPMVRQMAVWSLGQIGDRAAVPDLEKIMLKDSSTDVRAEAKNALRRVSGMKAPVRPVVPPPAPKIPDAPK